MTLLELKYFQAVCVHGSVSKAANLLKVSQPAISFAIKELEKEFGLCLFKRENNRLILSEDGCYFLKKINAILKDANSLEKEMKSHATRMQTINIGVPPLIGYFVFPPLVNGYLKENPGVHFSIVETGSLKILNHIDEGSIDLGLITYDEEVIKNCSYIELIDTEFLFAVHKDHPFAKKGQLTFEDLDNEEIILYSVGSYQDRLINKKIQEAKISPQVFLHSSQLATILECLKYPTVGAFLHKEIVEMNKDIVGIPFKEPLRVKVGLVYKKNTRLFARPASFVEYVKNVYKKP